jgi:hypothetical protein
VIQPVFDPIVGRVVTEADVVWEEVDECINRALQFAARDEEGHWFFEDLGQFHQVIAEVDEWNPAAQQAFNIRLQEALA